MKNLFSRFAVILILVATLGTILMSTGCGKTSTTSAKTPTGGPTTTQPEGFAIYLTKDNLTADQMPALNQIQIADTPLIAMSDIISYDDLTCRLTLAAMLPGASLIMVSRRLACPSWFASTGSRFIGASSGLRLHLLLHRLPVLSRITRCSRHSIWVPVKTASRVLIF